VGRQRAQALASLDLTCEPRIPAALPETTQNALARRPVAGLRDALKRTSAGAGSMPDATIVVVTANGLPELRLCLESIAAHTTDIDFDVQVIDDGSTDGTAALLGELAVAGSRLTAVFNNEPRGLAAARNQGLAMARGRIVVLLSQDAVVPPDWLKNLIACLDEPEVGLAGPMTNRASNKAQVPANYRTFGEFVAFANERVASGLQDVQQLNGFCVAMRREVSERIGPLDERFDLGVFQEQDLAMRILAAGLRVVCTNDVFVHHSGRSVIGHLTQAGISGDHFQTVRRTFESKWSTVWFAYDRAGIGHTGLRQMRSVLLDAIPPNAAVAIVSKGDDQLITLTGNARHFPGLEDGTYAGHHPATSAEAIAHLETQRAWGVQFLVIPAASSWWLTYYDGWRQHLETQYRAIIRDEDPCAVFDLRSPAS